ncbi:MAG: 30S ribosomal protein S12 methylthiotransferase RimO, partial [Limisphaerales bacterium]
MAKNLDKQQKIRVGMISLGCAKNLVDAEIMLGSLIKEGIEITNRAEEADVMIVNTCSFIDAAQEESVDAILESAEVREANNRGQGLIVSGCLPQRFRNELPTLLPEVDAFMGVDQVAQVPQIVKEALARRADKIANPEKTASRASKKKIAGKIAELQKDQPAHEHDHEESLRGTDQFGNTRKMVVPEAKKIPLTPVTPLVDVNIRPN